MTMIVWPTKADVGGEGQGRILSEHMFSMLLMYGFYNPFVYGVVLYGYGISRVAGTGAARVSYGVANLLGHLVYNDATADLTLTSAASNYIRLGVIASMVTPNPSSFEILSAGFSVATTPLGVSGGWTHTIPLWKVIVPAGGASWTSYTSYMPRLNTTVTTPTWS